MTWITPNWPAPGNVKACSTTRQGGVSVAPYDSLNLGLHVDDDKSLVLQNRAILKSELALPNEPIWLDQVHSATVVNADVQGQGLCKADSSVARDKGAVCLVMTADCLPVLFCNRQGTVVAAAHAGWRGLCDGILEETIKQMNCKPAELMAWMGPAIGPKAFEVGSEVRQAFIDKQSDTVKAFEPSNNTGRWMADIFMLARIRLADAGVSNIYGGGVCTYSNPQDFFSYRRDGVTGRMASLIWLD